MVANDLLPNDGKPSFCSTCGRRIIVEPTMMGDALCPACGSLVWPPPVSPQPSEKPRRRKFARYELVRIIRRGTSAISYLATTPEDRDVELTVLNLQLSESDGLMKRWKGEVLTAIKLKHPNLLTLFEIGTFKGLCYIVSDYVGHSTALDLVRSCGKLKPETAINIMLQTCAAVGHLHENNIMHRNLRPDCILLNESQRVFLCGYGVLGSLIDHTSENTFAIAPEAIGHMSPEQATCAIHVDARTDIYALGTIFYHLVTGHLPVTGESVLELIVKKETGEFIPVREQEPTLTEDLANVIHKMIAVDRDDRHQSCEEVLAELSAL